LRQNLFARGARHAPRKSFRPKSTSPDLHQREQNGNIYFDDEDMEPISAFSRRAYPSATAQARLAISPVQPLRQTKKDVIAGARLQRLRQRA
jgi:hypothetical protein